MAWTSTSVAMRPSVRTSSYGDTFTTRPAPRLSPRPRIGTLDERLEWFARYGVRECWVYHQPQRTLEVLSFVERTTRSSSRFEFHDRIVSSVFPEFHESCAAIVSPVYY